MALNDVDDVKIYRILRSPMAFSLALAQLFSPSLVTAQSSGLNDQVKMLNIQYQNDIEKANQDVANANQMMTQCGMQYQKGDDGKAHPDLEPEPDSNMVEAMIPAITSLGPALPALWDKLQGADSDSEKMRKRAIDSYNTELASFEREYGDVIGLRPLDLDTKKSDDVPPRSKAQMAAQSVCGKTKTPDPAAAAAGAPAAPTQDFNQCFMAAQNIGMAANELQSKLDLASDTRTATSALGTAALQAAAGGFMSKYSHDKQVDAVNRQNQLTTKAAQQGLKACEMNAQSQIDSAKRRLANVQNERADALRDLALRSAAELNNINQVAQNDESKTLPPVNPGNPNPAKGKPGANDLASNETPAAGAAGAGGAPGGASGGSGPPAWGFDGPQNGNYLGGGLPPPDASAQFAASGGGGAFSGGFSEDSMDALSLGQGGAMGGGAAERGIASSVGDGGIHVLMARMRIRFAYHAGELMQGVDLKALANKNGASEKAPKFEDEMDRMPASKL